MVILENFVDNFSKTLENKICRRRYELLFIELISFSKCLSKFCRYMSTSLILLSLIVTKSHYVDKDARIIHIFLFCHL